MKTAMKAVLKARRIQWRRFVIRRLFGLLLLSSFLLVCIGGARPTATQAATAESPIAQGVLAFDNGQYAAAIAQWQSALSELTSANTDRLTQAYLLSSLSAAYQNLAQPQNAQAALQQSLSIVQSWPEETLAYWEVSARVLNTQGQHQWQQGQTQQALATWQQAQQHYQRANSLSGVALTQINQAQAQQELGFNAQAVAQLYRLRDDLPTLAAPIRIAMAKELGKAFRRVGDLAEAEEVLSESLSQENISVLQRQQLQLERAHTVRALSHRKIASGQRKTASYYAERAIAAYRMAAKPTAASPSEPQFFLQVQAQLNQLSYLIETGQLEAAQSFGASLKAFDDLPLGRTSVEARISYAHSLACLQAPSGAACTKREWQDYTHKEPLASAQTSQQINQALWAPMVSQLKQAVEQSRALQDPLLESYALGELGHIYELTRQWDEATRLTDQALALLEGKSAPEIAYRWEWQQGRLYASQGRSSQSIAAYRQAITSLAAVRKNLLLVDPQIQFSFIDNVEPIYREFVSLLLGDRLNSDLQAESGAALETSQPDQASLRLAVQTLDALQLTELENFLGCNLSQLVNLNESSLDPGAVKIYPIILPTQLAIIFDIPNQPLLLRSVPVTQAVVERTLSELRNDLTSPGKTPAVLKTANQVYQWLIAPLEPILAENPQLETLVFVPDGPLRNIPMGVLYDGEQYLIEKDYAIAIAPQLNLFAPRTSPRQLKVLRGGIGLPQTIKNQNFPPIELIKAELDQIPEAFTVAPPLLDQDFTQANIEQALATQKYSAIHWKTHGVFSSTPAETFLVAYQDGINANELSSLVQSASQRQAEPFELLVLSACETAQGDRRAVLGLAGIAVRAGTRSTLSTLWRADDGANTQLMATFYECLREGMSKAKSLQRAQQALLKEEGYPAPYYWASYVLVGNWL